MELQPTKSKGVRTTVRGVRYFMVEVEGPRGEFALWDDPVLSSIQKI